MTEGYFGRGREDCPVCHGWGTVRETYGPPHNPVPTGYEERCDCRDELDAQDNLFDDPTVVDCEYDLYEVTDGDVLVPEAERAYRVPHPDEVAA